MINARAARLFRLAGKTYAKGDPISLPENQFNDLAGVGLVKRAPVPAKPVVFDDDNPEWTEEDFARARPASEVHPPEVATSLIKPKAAPRKPAPKRKPAAKKAS